MINYLFCDLKRDLQSREIRDISETISLAVAEKVFDLGIAGIERPEDLKKVISEYMYDPKY